MKHLASFADILPLSDFNLFDGSALVSVSGADADRIISDADLNFNPTPETSAAGPFFTERVRLVNSKLSESLRNKYTNSRAVIVLLFTDDGEPVLWGNTDQKVRITITPNTDYDLIELVRKTTKSLF